MAWLLDTNVFIAALKAHPAVRARLERLAASDIVLSPIVLGELETGVEKSTRIEYNRARLQSVVESFEVIALDATAARHYARIRAALEGLGTPIGANDLWIAAQALSVGAVLVTDNMREFQRVPGLALENWLESV
jgi:tRNA(fMet)-specific endonuclease VapC